MAKVMNIDVNDPQAPQLFLEQLNKHQANNLPQNNRPSATYNASDDAIAKQLDQMFEDAKKTSFIKGVNEPLEYTALKALNASDSES